MWSLTSLRANRISGSGEFRSSPPKDFCNTIPYRTDIIGQAGHVRKVPISGLIHRSKTRLFDHLVGELLQLQGHLKAERFGCREVDNQIEFSWLLYRKLAGLGSAQYLIH
jgi:hypothetical protein